MNIDDVKKMSKAERFRAMETLWDSLLYEKRKRNRLYNTGKASKPGPEIPVGKTIAEKGFLAPS